MIEPSRVRAGASGIGSREDLLRLVASLLAPEAPEAAAETERIAAALREREGLATTAVGSGVAFPHAKLRGLAAVRTALVTLPPPGIDMAAADGVPVRLVVALVFPEKAAAAHLRLLASFSTRLRDPATREAVLAASTAEEAVRALEGRGA